MKGLHFTFPVLPLQYWCIENSSTTMNILLTTIINQFLFLYIELFFCKCFSWTLFCLELFAILRSRQSHIFYFFYLFFLMFFTFIGICNFKMLPVNYLENENVSTLFRLMTLEHNLFPNILHQQKQVHPAVMCFLYLNKDIITIFN